MEEASPVSRRRIAAVLAALFAVAGLWATLSAASDGSSKQTRPAKPAKANDARSLSQRAHTKSVRSGDRDCPYKQRTDLSAAV